MCLSYGSHESVGWIQYLFRRFEVRIIQGGIDIKYLAFSLGGTAFLLAGCSEAPAEEIEELASEYGLEIQAAGETSVESGEIAELDEDEAGRLFQHISGALDDGTAADDRDVRFTPELEEPVEERGTAGVHTAFLKEINEGDSSGFERTIHFSYELEQGAEEITPDTIGMEDLTAVATGIPGFEWEEVRTNAHYDEETGEIEFYTTGKWVLHFLYEGAEVHYSFFDDWFVPLDTEEILEGLPSGW
jgi:hypothetical protein